MGNAAAFPEHLAEGNSTAQVHWCTARSPDVSLRGAKRRGNLAEHGRTTGKPSAKSQLPSRDCHVGLRPPRNDKFGGITRSSSPPVTCWPAWRSMSAATLVCAFGEGARKIVSAATFFSRTAALKNRRRGAHPCATACQKSPFGLFRQAASRIAK